MSLNTTENKSTKRKDKLKHNREQINKAKGELKHNREKINKAKR